MHEPAWWWVKASNLEGLERPVVRFDLAHVYTTLLYRYAYPIVRLRSLVSAIIESLDCCRIQPTTVTVQFSADTDCIIVQHASSCLSVFAPGLN